MNIEIVRRPRRPLIAGLVAAVAATLLLTALSGAAPAKKGLLDELELPMLSGAKLTDEINIPPGKLLDELAEEINGRLGMVDLKQLNTVTLSTGKSADEVAKFYEPKLVEQQWQVLARSVDRDGDGTALLYKDKKGLLIMVVASSDSDETSVTFVRMQGKIDTSKFGSGEKQMSEDLKKMLGGTLPDSASLGVKGTAVIPIGRPISVPPSEKLVIKATKSDMKATVLDQSTAEIRLTARKGTPGPGELVRVDDLLVLNLTPKLPVDEIDLPGAAPVAFEITDGSLTLTTGPKAGDKPSRLSIVSANAPVTLLKFALVSGSHMIKSVGGELNLDFSKVTGGEFAISATGDDVTIVLPKDASVKVDIDVVEGKIQKQIVADMQKDDPDRIVFQLGAGKAQIAVHAVKGNVCIKPAE